MLQQLKPLNTRRILDAELLECLIDSCNTIFFVTKKSQHEYDNFLNLKDLKLYNNEKN